MSLEPEFEALVLRLVPNLGREWRGASNDEILRLSEIAGQPLPRFYQWFLSTMGSSMGAFAFSTFDFRPQSIISAYDRGQISRIPSLLLTGYNLDEVMPLHTFYNLEKIARDDAMVETRSAAGGYVQTDFETLREKFTWRTLVWYRIEKTSDRCEGRIRSDSGDLASELRTVMAGMGFSEPVPTGAYCAAFERTDAAMVVRGEADESTPGSMSFRMCGSSHAVIRKILGVLATQSSMRAEVRKWNP